MSHIICLLSLNGAIIVKCSPHLSKHQLPRKNSYLATAPEQGFTDKQLCCHSKQKRLNPFCGSALHTTAC